MEKDESVEESSVSPAPSEDSVIMPADNASVPKKFPYSLLPFLKSRKKWQLFAMGAGLLILLLLALPVTRYPLLGVAMKKQVSIKVVDEKSGSPVSEAQVKLGAVTKNTNSEGIATFEDVKLGKATFTIAKNYYDEKTIDGFVGLSAFQAPEVKLFSQGRLLNLRVVNKISKQPLEGISIEALNSKALSDGEGRASLIVPLDTSEVAIKLTGNGYAEASREHKVADLENKTTDVGITPAGKIYFLSKQSGKIDVVETNLDGSDRQVVLAGTGYESDPETILLASRDWKYLVLSAKRDAKEDFNAIYLIDTASGKLTTIDEGDAYFTPQGWVNHTLIFTVDRNNIEYDADDKYRLKSFDAESKKLTTLDRNKSTDQFSFVSVTDEKVTYIKKSSGDECSTATNGVYTINPDGSNKQSVFESPIRKLALQWGAYTYKPGEYYFSGYENYCNNFSDPKEKYYEYELGGKVEVIERGEFVKEQNQSRTYVVSPNGERVFWSEKRDGKSTLFLGDIKLENKKTVHTVADGHNAYGWYGEEYVLVSKGGSELYIMPRDGGELLKISDYHKPDYDYSGYGYGYGGA